MGISALAGKLHDSDINVLNTIDDIYQKALEEFVDLDNKEKIINIFEQIGSTMREFIKTEPRLQVYSFAQPPESHGEVSRLIAKLRDVQTSHEEFLYYIQRAYELIFKQVYNTHKEVLRGHKIVKTPITIPVQNYAVHKMPNIDNLVKNTVMCVMLRGALLPSMIMSKEIQEYASDGLITPFALFRIKRNELLGAKDMEYIIDLQSSYFQAEALQDKDLIFADPMNATGGSLVAIINYLKNIGVRPRSVKCFNVIASLRGMLQVIRSVENATVYSLWVDPVLNDKAYIMPGLGDAGDRLNGMDCEDNPREIIQLLADYGANIINLYRAQVREIERTVLKK